MQICIFVQIQDVENRRKITALLELAGKTDTDITRVLNNEDKVEGFAQTLAKYAHGLRGFTVYPDGARGGQPLTSVKYSEAVEKTGDEFEESIETHDICDITQHGGSCGV